jgi:UDP-N-acetylmuramate--alanine ligase
MTRTKEQADADLRELAQRGPIHFVGIGGAGMSALAELLLKAGATITGCDSTHSAITDRLRARGATIHIGQDPAHIEPGVAAVITTSAVHLDHPELQAALEAGVPVLKRAQALGAFVNQGTVVAIAGTHGKTTTTAMTTAVLSEAGLEPTAFVGGTVPGWESGLHRGGDQLFVVEADEYDRSFHTLRPTVAVVTTLEADHLDIYGSLEGVEAAFAEFVQLVPSDEGRLVACGDDAGASKLAKRAPKGVAVTTYGIESDAQVRALDIEVRGRGSRFRVSDRGEDLGELNLAVAGYHNIRNALAATSVGLHFGTPFEATQRALARFGGVTRRFQELGRVDGITVIDDYAHHPTEIRATLSAARASYPDQRLIAVFQPHLYSRTRDFAADFGVALSSADVVWICDVYPAREAPIPGITGELIVAATKRAGARDVTYEPDHSHIPGRMRNDLHSGDVVVFMGAGSIEKDGAALLRLLVGQQGGAL